MGSCLVQYEGINSYQICARLLEEEDGNQCFSNVIVTVYFTYFEGRITRRPCYLSKRLSSVTYMLP